MEFDYILLLFSGVLLLVIFIPVCLRFTDTLLIILSGNPSKYTGRVQGVVSAAYVARIKGLDILYYLGWARYVYLEIEYSVSGIEYRTTRTDLFSKKIPQTDNYWYALQSVVTFRRFGEAEIYHVGESVLVNFSEKNPELSYVTNRKLVNLIFDISISISILFLFYMSWDSIVRHIMEKSSIL
jgi:hypothetical protein